MSDQVAQEHIEALKQHSRDLRDNTAAIMLLTSPFVDAKQACAILGYSDVKSLRKLRANIKAEELKKHGTKKMLFKRSDVEKLRLSRQIIEQND